MLIIEAVYALLSPETMHVYCWQEKPTCAMCGKECHEAEMIQKAGGWSSAKS